MPKLNAFLIGVLGSFVVYYLTYGEERFLLFLKDPRKNWRVFLFDLVMYLACGGLVTAFLVEPKSAKEAFMGGCSWQGIIGGSIAGSELRAKRTVEESGA